MVFGLFSASKAIVFYVLFISISCYKLVLFVIIGTIDWFYSSAGFGEGLLLGLGCKLFTSSTNDFIMYIGKLNLTVVLFSYKSYLEGGLALSISNL
jgi:hypothetical protein